jgi:hypothetical protein
VYKLQNPESRLKYKSFLLEGADYWAGMTLEGTNEVDEIEATDEADDPSPPTISNFKFHYDICSRLVIIAVYMNACIFNNTNKIIRSTGKGVIENIDIRSSMS